jgi:hypothetical protein
MIFYIKRASERCPVSAKPIEGSISIPSMMYTYDNSSILEPLKYRDGIICVIDLEMVELMGLLKMQGDCIFSSISEIPGDDNHPVIAKDASQQQLINSVAGTVIIYDDDVE